MQDMAADRVAPWEASSYSYEEMLTFFPDTSYNHLVSIHVHPVTGNDTTGNGTFSTPFKTPQKAIDYLDGKGGRVLLWTGTYNEPIKIPPHKGGTKDNPLVIQNNGTAILDLKYLHDYSIEITGKHVIIDGLSMWDVRLNHIYIHPSTQKASDAYVTIRNCSMLKSNEALIKAENINYLLVEDCRFMGITYSQPGELPALIEGYGVYHSIFHFNDISVTLSYADFSSGGVSFGAGCSNNIWAYNNFRNFKHSSINYDKSSYGLQLGGTSSFSEVYRDEAYFEYPQAYHQLVINNIFENCMTSGIHIQDAWKCMIYNNTFYNCGYATSTPSNTKATIRWSASEKPFPNKMPSSSGIEFINNIAYTPATFNTDYFLHSFTPNSKFNLLTHSHNTIFGINDWGYTPNISEAIEDPLFDIFASYHLILSANSPARTSGISLPEVKQGILRFDVNFVPILINRPNQPARGAFQP